MQIVTEQLQISGRMGVMRGGKYLSLDSGKGDVAGKIVVRWFVGSLVR